jgi:hypothetical protein
MAPRENSPPGRWPTSSLCSLPPIATASSNASTTTAARRSSRHTAFASTAWVRTATRPLSSAPEASTPTVSAKPYDRVVMQVLLLLAYHLADFEISSDGSFDEEWSAALDWFNGEIGSVFVVQRLSFLSHGYDEPPSVTSS